MRQSQLFTKTRKEAPKDETSKNAQLLTRGGFVHKEMAGVYAFLPLGLRVLENINNVIRQEMNAIGGQELQLTGLQNPETWQTTNRWSDEEVDNWFKTTLANGSELGLGWTHEEPITQMMSHFIDSYRDLPTAAYQIQTKFRNEVRAKSGIMRGREFLMKDLYSFSRTDAEHNEFYEKAKEAYLRIFERLGLGERTFVTSASGGSFSAYSHEFQTISEAGEDTIYLDRQKEAAINDEIYSDEVVADLELEKSKLEQVKAIEVGNIFSLGTKFSDAFGLSYRAKDGSEQPVIMGSYGIGPGRVMGTIVEVCSDESGMVWPEEIAPFQIHLLSFGADEEAENCYRRLTERGIEVLFDDRQVSAGEKFADADLLGVPYRAVISDKTAAQGNIELKTRTQSESELISEDELTERLGGRQRV